MENNKSIINYVNLKEQGSEKRSSLHSYLIFFHFTFLCHSNALNEKSARFLFRSRLISNFSLNALRYSLQSQRGLRSRASLSLAVGEAIQFLGVPMDISYSFLSYR